MRMTSTTIFLVYIHVMAMFCVTTSALTTLQTSRRMDTTVLSRPALHVAAATEDDVDKEDDALLYSDDDDDDDEDEEEEPSTFFKKSARWNALVPRVKQRIMKEAQERAIANKKKRERNQDKKRRMMMFFKKKQKQKKHESRIQRSLPFDQRTPLSELDAEKEVEGTVISLTNFGAYVDIGTECDGLLHVSQITRDFFVEHPRQVLTPGDAVTVTIRSVNPEKKKLQLTMLPKEWWQPDDEDEEEERIPLEDIDVDDELWGEIKRVTDYGAYVEVGAVVDGFLHFMDHPGFGSTPGAPPSDFMNNGDRVRVWVADVDMDKRRIKLTANRPAHLPGPRRDIY